MARRRLGHGGECPFTCTIVFLQELHSVLPNLVSFSRKAGNLFGGHSVCTKLRPSAAWLCTRAMSEHPLLPGSPWPSPGLASWRCTVLGASTAWSCGSSQLRLWGSSCVAWDMMFCPKDGAGLRQCGGFEVLADSLGCFPGTGVTGVQNPEHAGPPGSRQHPLPRSQPKAELEAKGFVGSRALPAGWTSPSPPKRRGQTAAPEFEGGYWRGDITGLQAASADACRPHAAISPTFLRHPWGIGGLGLKGQCPASPPAHAFPL